MTILSILIPTYNRADKLSVLLGHLLPVNSLVSLGKLEVVVSNNASTDHTRAVVENYQESLLFRYYEQKSNLGFDGNVKFLYKAQEGAWSLLVGDDDLLAVNLLPDILVLLSNSDQASLYLLPSLSIEKNMISQSWPKLELPNSILPYPRGFLLLLRRGVSRFGFIGCHVFPSSLTKTSLGLVGRPEFAYWSHLFLFLSALKHRFALKYIDTPLVIQRLDSSARRYHYSFWSLLFFQRLLGLKALIHGNDHASNVFLFSLVVREALSFQMVKEFIRLAFFYNKTFSHRVGKLKNICRERLLGQGKLFAVYIFFLFGLCFAFSIALRLLASIQFIAIYWASCARAIRRISSRS